MSVESELKRIADALERITTPTTSGTTENTVPPPTAELVGAPDLLPVTSAKKPGRKKAEPAANTAAPTAQPAVKPEVSKDDITAVLQSFLKKFPGPAGADKARVFFTNAGAKNITSLDPTKYKEVFLGLSEAVK